MANRLFRGLSVVLVEDDPTDADLVTRTLQGADPDCVVRVVQDQATFRRELDAGAPDVVLSDHGVPGFGSCDALTYVQRHQPVTPFLLVGGAFDRSATACLKAGAADFVLESDLPRLPEAIAGALKQREPLRRLSDRQLEVLQLLATGSTTRQVAARLKLSIKTVETHRANALKRLGIRNLADLVRFAVRLGVVSPLEG